MQTSTIFLAFFAAIAPSSAYIFPFIRHADRNLAQLEARQNNAASPTISKTSFDLSLTLVQGNTATTVTSNTASATGGSNSNSGTTGGSGSATDSDSGTKVTYATTETFDARLPAGGIQMITPAPIAVSSYYKIKDHVTFAWNYTSLSVTPSAVDVLASCTLNGATYTIAANVSIDGPQQTVVWDTGAFQNSAKQPLLTSQYTLIVHDSSKDVKAIAQAGYLATFSNLRFGMYIPQPYVEYKDWKCPSCTKSSAAVAMIAQPTALMAGLVVVSIASLVWL